MDIPVTGAWVLGNDVLTSSGSPFTGPYDPAKCGPDAEGSRNDCTRSLAAQGLQQRVDYLGAGKFWTLQWRELGVLLVVSGLMGVFCLWWMRRRVA